MDHQLPPPVNPPHLEAVTPKTIDDLSPVEALLQMAIITDQDIEDAISQWRSDPPDSAFALLLDAEIEEV